MLRTFSPSSNPMELVSEAPLKPARKCLQSFGESFLDETGDGVQIGSNCAAHYFMLTGKHDKNF